MVWLDLHAKSALNTGTPSVEAHKCAVILHSSKKHNKIFKISLTKNCTMRVRIPYPYCTGAACAKNHLFAHTRTNKDTSFSRNFN